MAANIPGAGQIITTSPMQMQVPATLVNTVPMGVPPLAQLTPSVPSMVHVQQHTTAVSAVPTSIQNNLATSSMQVQSVVPATLASPVMTATQSKPATVISNPITPSATVTNATSTSTSSHNIMQSSGEGMLLSRNRLQDLVREVDSTEQLDEEVEDLLLQLADDFVESTVNAACLLAKHRKATTVEVKDVQLHLERNWNMWTPGFGTDELRPYKRAPVTEAHKQRLALIRKAIKKY